MARVNPFFEPSTLPFQAPPFDLIEEEDYEVALEEGMVREMDEVRAIATNPDPPTFANTIEALERAGVLLRRVYSVFQAIADSDSTPGLRRIDAAQAPRLAAHQDAIYFNTQLFARIKALHDARDTLTLDPESRRLIDRRYRDFVRAGAGLSADDQNTLRILNEEQASLTAQYRERLLAATNANAVLVTHQEALEGLPPEDQAAAAQHAIDCGFNEGYLLALQNTTQQPVLATLDRRETRRRVLEASMTRGRGGAHDLAGIASRLAQLRAERARLLGFSSFAALELDDQMARTPERALELLTGLIPGVTAKVQEEAAQLQSLVDDSGGGFELGAHDWPYFAERRRRLEYAIDLSDVQGYFELDRVVHDGVFHAATELYGITARPRNDIPVYHPDVRVYDIIDEDGAPLALFYLDMFARPTKSGGAWSHDFVSQSRLLGTRPVIVNVLNVTKPAEGDPVLLTFDEVITLFHEFGHALHAMFSNTIYPTLAGTNGPHDWLEFPSQLNEHCALDPGVFRRYARHYETGAPMPESVFQKIRQIRTFNQSYRTAEYLAAALIDHAWHTVSADDPLKDVEAFETAVLDRFGMRIPAIPPRYSSPYFLHIWGRGYAALYYAYMWAEVLEADAWRWIEEHGGITRENGTRLREKALSRGATEDGDVMFREFCGRDPDREAFLVARGLA